jgi:predicted membrane-bound spermidine synthase
LSAAQPTPSPSADTLRRRTLLRIAFALAFFVSGMAALTYQLCWNRLLFAAVGVDLDSTTIVVSAFMLGLGAGSALASWLAARWKGSLVAFCVIEFAMLLCGLASAIVLDTVALALVRWPRPVAALGAFLLLLVPTMLMGATLPLMTGAAQQRPGLKGIPFSSLYIANTFGGGAGALLAGFVLIGALGLRATLWCAAAGNLLAAAICGLLLWLEPRDAARGAAPESASSSPTALQVERGDGVSGRAAAPRTAVLLAFASGLLALAAEICWLRLFAYSYHGTPTVTPFVIGWFLLGLAAGGALLRRRALADRGYETAARCFVVAGLIDIGLLCFYLVFDPTGFAKIALGALMIFASGLSKGAVLTSIADRVPADRPAGAWAGVVVTANIAGATIGPILTTYWLFDSVGLLRSVGLVALLSALTGLIALGRRPGAPLLGAAMATATLGLFVPASLLHRILESGPDGAAAIVHAIENRHGLVHAARDPYPGDVIFGANLYDGRVNLDPGVDINGISRVYCTLAFAERTQRVLLIGLGSGSWLDVVRHFDGVGEIVVVELNPAYRDLMASYPEFRGALADPRIRWEFTDGRRWLRQNPDARFDLIVMNSSFAWRAFASNLLSVAFFEELKAHLNPGGSIGVNPTGSIHVAYTFAHVFPKSVILDGYLMGPLSDDAAMRGRAAARLARLAQTDFGRAIEKRDGAQIWSLLAGKPLVSLRDYLAQAQEPGELIDEDRLITEYRYGRPLDAAHFREQFR